jgi:hypothetical protein
MAEITKDEAELLNEYRALKDLKHGDLHVSVKNEEMVKLWVTTQTTRKVDLANVAHLKEEGK